MLGFLSSYGTALEAYHSQPIGYYLTTSGPTMPKAAPELNLFQSKERVLRYLPMQRENPKRG